MGFHSATSPDSRPPHHQPPAEPMNTGGPNRRATHDRNASASDGSGAARARTSSSQWSLIHFASIVRTDGGRYWMVDRHRVTNNVKTFQAWGMGSYSFFNQGVNLYSANAFVVPTN